MQGDLKYMKLYSPNHGNSKDRETDIYKESKHGICYSKVLTRGPIFKKS